MRACLVAVLAILLAPWAARAHCDGLDGPVVNAGRKALASGDLNPALIWVQPEHEKELRAAFAQALRAPSRGGEGDTRFFETLVRLHRAGEGAPYTGLKPAGRDLGPLIPAADRALETGSAEALLKLVEPAIREKVALRFREATKRKQFAPQDIAAGRAYVRAYVEFIHSFEEEGEHEH